MKFYICVKGRTRKLCFLKSTLLRRMIRYVEIILFMFSRRLVLVRLGVNGFEVLSVMLRPRFWSMGARQMNFSSIVGLNKVTLCLLFICSGYGVVAFIFQSCGRGRAI